MGVQVTELTKGKPCYKKEFIDFEFDGKHISDFGMVAVFDGDRFSFSSSPSFDEEISEIKGKDGQLFWGTHFEPLKLDFSLATDGMTEAQFNAFKKHFTPGKYGKFIEDRYAHRYNWGRISSQIDFKMIPFQKKETFLINNISHTIDINEYKGECEISFIFDFPFFYATENYLPDVTKDNFEEVLRAVYTNGTPLKTSWMKPVKCHIGDASYALGNRSLVTNTYSGTEPLIYYNPSSAKTQSKITITFEPEISSTWPRFFTNISDDINQKGEDIQYNSISITSSLPASQTPVDEDYNIKFKYTTPEIIYSIHKAIQIAYDFYNKTPTGLALELEEQLREEITNSKVISWAILALQIIQSRVALYEKNTGNFLKGLVPGVNCAAMGLTNAELNWFEYFNVYMLLLFANCEDGNLYHIDNIENLQGTWTEFNSFTICFNGDIAKTTISYKYNQVKSVLTNFSVSEENCGNATLTEYLILDGGDVLNDACDIKTCHYLKFLKGQSQSLTTLKVAFATLEYQHTY